MYKIKGIAHLNAQDTQAIYRLIEQSEAIFEMTKSMPKMPHFFQKAQQIQQDIQKILQQSHESNIVDLFEVVIAPQLVRLAQALQLEKSLAKTLPKTAVGMLKPAFPKNRSNIKK